MDSSPVEVDPLLGQLSRAMHRVLIRLILDHLHPLAPVALLVAVLADHVQLPDSVLQKQKDGNYQNILQTDGTL